MPTAIPLPEEEVSLKHSLNLFFAIAVVCSLIAGCSAQPQEKASLVVKNGYIYTVDEKRTVAEAMALKGNTIVYIGTNAGVKKWIGNDTQVIDLEGRLVLPGLIDSHAHATSGVSDIYEVSLYGIGSIEEYQQTIADFVANQPGLTALQGAGWINAVFGPSGPTAAMLDAVVQDIPAVLNSEDYHSAWVNSKTFELAGINKDTPDPVGGIIERDDFGNPLGTLRESAMDLVADVIPPYTTEQLIEGLTYFQKFAHSLGLTTVYIPDLPSADRTGLRALHKFEASGNMTIRFPTAMGVNPEDDISVVDQITQKQKAEAGGNFEIIAAKIFMDGVLEGETAYLEQPYLIRPDYRGELLWDPQKYDQMCAALDKAGIQIHVHSIGDAATRITLDGFAYARQQNGKRDSRNMITHIQLVNPADIKRFADLGVIAVPQPYWFVIDTYYTQAVEYVGQERADKQYPMKSFFDNGVVVASASDYPVSWPPDPMLAIELGMTRTVPEGSEIYVDPDFKTALNPSEDVTVEDMITSFTINGAYAAFMENEIGSLQVGKKADFIVLDQNILKIDPKQIHDTTVLLTYFEGQEVYRSEAYTGE
jgi:predicted amidohydrolase YtcJ